MTRLLASLCLCLLTLPLTANELPISVDAPWVREAPPGTDVNGGYMRIRNDGDEDVKLIRAGSPDFARVEMHETVVVEERSRMRKLDEIHVPAGGTVELKPGGLHLMLFGPRSRPEAGNALTLTLEFDNGQMIEIGAPGRRRAGPGGPTE
jgi:copper(I)-binding protein